MKVKFALGKDLKKIMEQKRKATFKQYLKVIVGHSHGNQYSHGRLIQN